MQGLIDKIRDEARDAVNILSPLTKSTLVEVNMAKKSLPFSNKSKKQCGVAECDRAFYGNGYCRAHYMRAYRGRDMNGRVKTTSAGKLCEVAHCNRPQASRAWCHKHYMRWWSTGSPLKGSRSKPTKSEIFWACVDKNGPIHPSLGTRCWLWTGKSASAGYGKIGNVRAHRYSYFLHHGRWPDPFCCHHCDTPPCVNPEHLFEGTPRDNTLDMVRKGRHGRKGPTRTHCTHGHELSGNNVRLEAILNRPNPRRRCVICYRTKLDARKSRRTESRNEKRVE